MIQRRLQVKNTEMKMTKVSTLQFGSLNNKRYYFSDGIVSLPFGHLLLSPVQEIKNLSLKFKPSSGKRERSC